MSNVFSHEEISFRVPTKEDLEEIRKLRNDESTWTHLTDPRPLGPADQKAWYESLGSRSGKYYFVVSDQHYAFIGLVRMDEHDLINQSIRVGADVSVSLRGKGYGKKIYAAIKDYCFRELNVHRVWLLVLATNVVGRGLYKKSGFTEEGVMRGAIYRHGQWVDYLMMSILRGESK